MGDEEWDGSAEWLGGPASDSPGGTPGCRDPWSVPVDPCPEALERLERSALADVARLDSSGPVELLASPRARSRRLRELVAVWPGFDAAADPNAGPRVQRSPDPSWTHPAP